MVAMTSFHGEKCCHLVSEYQASTATLCSNIHQFLIYRIFVDCLRVLIWEMPWAGFDLCYRYGKRGLISGKFKTWTRRTLHHPTTLTLSAAVRTASSVVNLWNLSSTTSEQRIFWSGRGTRTVPMSTTGQLFTTPILILTCIHLVHTQVMCHSSWFVA